MMKEQLSILFVFEEISTEPNQIQKMKHI